ncbi:GDSL esterase/lipase, partial [Mucuna pruriens]
MACELVIFFPFWTVLLISASSNDVAEEPLFSAMFVFGDSLLDSGNNNYLNTFAKANFTPYGIDFSEGPTGRFTNGKTLAKTFPGELNYASAASGILEETGRNLGEHISFSHQVQNFKTTVRQLKIQMEERKLSQPLANSLAVVDHGNNDYINNYLIPEQYGSSFLYNSKEYADFLIKLYKGKILTLHGLGLRKFLLGGLAPLGCIPSQLSTGLAPPGECRSYVNDIVDMFNVLLRSLVDQLNANHHGSIFVYGNTYRIFSELIHNAKAYVWWDLSCTGFTVTDTGCCGIGRNLGQITCLPLFVSCEDRDRYLFWDPFHTTEAVNKIVACRAFAGPPFDCYPLNIKLMAQMYGHNKTSLTSIVSKN